MVHYARLIVDYIITDRNLRIKRTFKHTKPNVHIITEQVTHQIVINNIDQSKHN